MLLATFMNSRHYPINWEDTLLCCETGGMPHMYGIFANGVCVKRLASRLPVLANPLNVLHNNRVFKNSASSLQRISTVCGYIKTVREVDLQEILKIPSYTPISGYRTPQTEVFHP